MDARLATAWLLVIVFGVATMPTTACASQAVSTRVGKRLPVVGYLGGNRSPVLGPVLSRMRDLGYVPERDFRLEERLTEGSVEKQSRFAADLVALQPDIIVATGLASLDLKKRTSTIPIVLTVTPEATAQRVIASFDLPEGNITGVVARESVRIQKQLSLQKDVVPGMTKAAMLRDAGLARSAELQAVAAALGLRSSSCR